MAKTLEQLIKERESLREQAEQQKQIYELDNRRTKALEKSQQLTKKVLNLDKEITKEKKAQVKAVSDQEKAEKALADRTKKDADVAASNAKKRKQIQDTLTKAREVEGKTFSKALTDLAKGNVLQALGYKSVKAQSVAQANLAQGAEDFAVEVQKARKLEEIRPDDYGRILNLTKGITEGTIEQEDLQEQLNALSEEGQQYMANKKGVAENLIKLKDKEKEATKAQGKAEDRIAKVRMAKLAALGFAYKAISSVIGFLIKSATAFSEKLNKIGAQFGSLTDLSSEVTNNIIEAQQNVALVGASIDDVLSTTAKLATEFGLTDDVASGISDNIIDSAKAIGLSNDEAASLTGLFMQIGGLTQEEVENLTEGAKQLGDQNKITSQVQAGLKDLVGSADNFAKFIGGGVEQLVAGATEIRRLGLNMDEVANAGRSLLDLTSSYQKEAQASVLLGRQINLNEARRMFMMKDLVGLTAELKKQAGGVEFINLDALTQETLADALGMSVGAVAKLVTATDELDIAGALAGKSFKDLLGQESLGGIQRLRGEFDTLIMKIRDGLGDSINTVAVSLSNFLKDSEKVQRLREMVGNLGNVLVGVAESLSSFFNSVPADSDPITHMFDRIGASIARTLRMLANFASFAGLAITLLSGGTAVGAGLGLGLAGVGLREMADSIDENPYDVPKARDGAEVEVHDGEVILNPVQQSGIMDSNKEVVAVLNKMNKINPVEQSIEINPVQQPMVMDSNSNKEIVAGLNKIHERLALGIPMSTTIKGGQINIATDEGYAGGGPEYSNIVVKG